MAPVARELAADCGILEPMQTALSLDGQIDELAGILKKHATLPAVLIGFSWGAWLSICCAARYPPLIRKLILVGCPGLEEKDATGLQETRLNRLDERHRAEAHSLLASLSHEDGRNETPLLARLSELFARADAFDPDDSPAPEILGPIEPFQQVWREGAAWRKDGRLLAQAAAIRCPVVAIHGDHDPHPAEGVRAPLATRMVDFRFILLTECGHKPWIERRAKDEFYRILRAELC